jgi:hypothetical protein
LTEIGRRGAILAGTLAFAVTMLVGIIADGDLMMASLLALCAGLIFGTGGLLVGNLLESYTTAFSKREYMQRMLERKFARELAAEARKSNKKKTAENA